MLTLSRYQRCGAIARADCPTVPECGYYPRNDAERLRRMNDYGFRHLPVVQSGKILGILTRSSFKGMEIDQLDEEIHLWECIR